MQFHRKGFFARHRGQVATIALLAASIWTVGTSSARAQSFVDFGNVAGTGLTGSTGFADLLLPTMGGSVGYVNIAADFGSGAQWLVQNFTVPLQSTDYGGNAAVLGFTFDTTGLGASPSGTYSVFADITSAPIGSVGSIPSQGSAQFLTYNIGTLQDVTGVPPVTDGGGPSIGPTGPPISVIPSDDPGFNAGGIIGRVRHDVPGILQAKNECAPTSAVQSLLWMQSRGQISGIPTQATLLTDLKQAMNPGSPQASGSYNGINPANFLPGKQQVTTNDRIPVSSSSGGAFNGTGTFDYIKAQIEKGNDVEMRIQYPGDGGHWVTIAGWYDDGTTRKLYFKDPLTGGLTVDSYTIVGNVIQGYKYAGPAGATISFAVSEGAAPEPGTFALITVGLVSLGGATRIRRRRRTAVLA